jgi:trigger factor
MQLTIQDISPVEKRVDFEVPWTEVSPRLDKAYNDLRRDVRLRGFRPGKAPRPVLEKLYRGQVEEDVARELVELSLGQAIRERQIEPVAPPRVDRIDLRSGQPFKFSARVEVRSQVEPKNYTGIPLERRPPRVGDEQLAEALERYRKQLTTFTPVEGRAESRSSDVLLVELSGRIGEHKIKKNSVAVDLGEEAEADAPLPGLPAQLRGIAIASGSQHEIRYTIAEDTKPKELAGKQVSLKVTIKEARERKTPSLDDELAKDTGEADTLEELKGKVRERLLEADKTRVKRELESALVKELVKRNPFAIAKALVERHAEGILARARMQLSMMGLDVESLDPERMKAEFKDEAEEEARASVLLRAIAEREGVEVTDGDVQKRVAELAAARQTSAKKLRAELEQNQSMPALKAQIREEKTLELLVSQAKITDADPDRLIVTPQEARKVGGRLILSPEEARNEAERSEQAAGETAEPRIIK